MSTEAEYRARFGARLSRLRREAGLTLAGVADHCGVSRAAVGQWENGQTAPMAAKRQLVAELLSQGFDDADVMAEVLPLDDEQPKKRGRPRLNPNEEPGEPGKAGRLKQSRELAGFATAAAAAAALRVPYSSYAGHEGGQRGFRRAEVLRYAETFGVDPAWLEFGTGPQPTGASKPPRRTGGTLLDRMAREQDDLIEKIARLRSELAEAEGELSVVAATVLQLQGKAAA